MALAGALANTLCAVTGITNKSLRAFMTGLLGRAALRTIDHEVCSRLAAVRLPAAA